MEYYVYHDGRQVGPLSVSEVASRLANGDFSESDHVWHQGLSQTKALSEVFRSQSKTMPPAPVERRQNHQRLTQPAPPAQQPRNQSTIPAEVMQTIRAVATRDHPDDYSTQKYIIEDQCESFLAIKNLSAPDIPAHVLTTVCERAAIEHPDDYSTQKYIIEDQLEAYRNLHFD